MSRNEFTFPVSDGLPFRHQFRITTGRLDDIAPKDPFTESEREAIWEGLKSLTKEGRLKLIKQVKDELKRHDKKGLYKLANYPQHELIIKRADRTRLYQDITSRHPDLIPINSRHDPADPWLIVASEKFGHTIICEELSKNDRSKHLPRHRLDMERIPDVCSVRQLPNSITLRQLAKDEGWIQ